MEYFFGMIVACVVVYAAVGGVVSEIKARHDKRSYQKWLADNPELKKILEEE